MSEPNVILEIGLSITPDEAEVIRSSYLRRDTEPVEWKRIKRKFHVEVVRFTATPLPRRAALDSTDARAVD